MKNSLIATAVTGLLLTGCETTSSRPYSPSTENIVALQQSIAKQGKVVGLGDFDAAADVDTELTCRAMGAIDVGSGKSAVEFIEDAMRTELFQADSFDPNSANKISGTVTQFDADSWGTGNWKLSLKLVSDVHPSGYNVSSSYDFKSSFSALNACQNVVDAFTPAVQKLIKTAIEHPDFSKLTG